MFGSQALETAIGLALMFFVLATAASAVVEAGSRFTRLRAKGLQRALGRIITSEEHPPWIGDAKVDHVIKQATGRTRSAYLSAKSFADAVTELASKVTVLDDPAFKPMMDKLDTLAREAKGDLTKVKAGLETWFDQTMNAVAQTYKKFAALVLLLVGLGLAIGLNASTVDVAQDLWTDSVKRAVVVEAAGKVTSDPSSVECKKDNEIETAACAVDKVDDFGLPMGWGSGDHNVWDNSASWWARHLAGWLITAFLVMLGAPFWFDLLTRLVALRGSGPPKPASEDETSNSTQLLKADAAPEPEKVYFGVDEASGTDWLATALNLKEDSAWLTSRRSQKVGTAAPAP